MIKPKRRLLKTIILTLLLQTMTVLAIPHTITLRFVETSDVHGAFFPTDYMTGRLARGSMARVATYVGQLRAERGNNVVLLDNGDILQGQPTNYYWNFMCPEVENIASKVVNFMGYDALVVGNHDVETGHAVYDKWVGEVDCPVLAANVVRTADGTPYFQPYTIVEREGVRIAVVGMLTPAVPNWLSPDLYEGMAFEEIVASARKWIGVVREKERADVIVGLFHSGRVGGIVTPDYEEDVVERVAKEVEGFDIIFFGHDHNACCKMVDGTFLVNPGCNARRVGDATVTLRFDGGRMVDKRVKADVVAMDSLDIDEAYMDFFAADVAELKEFTQRPIGVFDTTVRTFDSFFGSSAFSDLIHNLQLKITGADISLNAPLQFDGVIEQGVVTMADMFNLYKYENQLYVMRMTGREVRGHLEMSYALWTNQMRSPDDHILLLSPVAGGQQRMGFRNYLFNFDSAAGIDYEVDVTKPEGEKVRILRMSNGEEFDENRYYRVAVNSYRGNGGGELLTKGAGIPRDSLQGRIVYRSELDQRYYLMKEIERLGHVNPLPNNNWRFVPEEWTREALRRDRQFLIQNS